MAVIRFDPGKHPRGLKGRFREVVAALRVGDTVRLPDGIAVRRVDPALNGGTKFQVRKDDRFIHGAEGVGEAAGTALVQSAQNTHAKSVGGSTSHPDLVQATETPAEARVRWAQREVGTGRNMEQKAEAEAELADAIEALDNERLREASKSLTDDHRRIVQMIADLGPTDEFGAQAAAGILPGPALRALRDLEDMGILRSRPNRFADADPADFGGTEQIEWALTSVGERLLPVHTDRQYKLVGPDTKFNPDAEYVVLARDEDGVVFEAFKGTLPDAYTYQEKNPDDWDLAGIHEKTSKSPFTFSRVVYDAFLRLARTKRSSGTISRRNRSNRSAVLNLQHVLNAVGDDIEADGIYGPKTKSAVERFQERNGLEVDGVVGRQTLRAFKHARSQSDSMLGIDAMEYEIDPIKRGTRRSKSIGTDRLGRQRAKRGTTTPKGPHGGTVAASGKEIASSSTGPIGTTDITKDKLNPLGANPSNAAFEEAHPRAAGGAPGGGRFIAKGASGAQVQQAQTKLNENGARLKVDGQFGTRTNAAVKAFQRQKNLKVDGVVGPITFDVLTGKKKKKRSAA